MADDWVTVAVVKKGDGVGPEDEGGFTDEVGMSYSMSVAEDTAFGTAVKVEKSAVFAGGGIVAQHEVFVAGEWEFEQRSEEVFLLFEEFGVELAPGIGRAEGASELPDSMGIHFMSDDVWVVIGVGVAGWVGSRAEGWIEGNDIVAIVDIAFEHEAGEVGFEAVGGDSGWSKIAVGGQV